MNEHQFGANKLKEQPPPSELKNTVRLTGLTQHHSDTFTPTSRTNIFACSDPGGLIHATTVKQLQCLQEKCKCAKPMFAFGGERMQSH